MVDTLVEAVENMLKPTKNNIKLKHFIYDVKKYILNITCSPVLSSVSG